MFACLGLRGRSFGSPYAPGSKLQKGYDSHHAACSGLEWIIFDSAAVLPIYLFAADEGNPTPAVFQPPAPFVKKKMVAIKKPKPAAVNFKQRR